MKWSVRQNYYVDLLKNLGIWKDSLADRLDYYMEPGSPYQPDPEGEHFRGLGIRELPVPIFVRFAGHTSPEKKELLIITS